MSKLDLAYWQKAFANLADVFDREEMRLCRLDGATGDGDHGTSMSLGFRKAAAAPGAEGPPDITALFQSTGDAFVTSVGGVTGIIFGTWFKEAGKKTQGLTEIDTRGLAEMFGCALAKIRKRGKVANGDKSMVDALWPAVASLEEAAEKGLDPADALALARESAREGMDATRVMEARVGRARYQKDKGAGHTDPGAASVALVFETLAQTAGESE